MITRRTQLQLLVFALVAVFGLVYTGVRYAGLAKYVPGHDNGYVVSAQFSDSGGIFTGAEVTYRGVPVGKVEQLSLHGDGIAVALRLKPGTKVPTPTRAVIGNRSAVGEQFVDLQPQSDGATMLKGGDVIPVAMTRIPISPTQLIVNLDRLVNSVDTADVTVVLDELGQAFDGVGPDLQRLIDAGDQLTSAATANLPQTIKLIRDGKPVLKTQNDVAGSFRSYTRDLALLTAQLRSSDPDFRALFKSGTDSAVVTKELLDANQAALPVLLSNLVSTAQIQAVRIPGLRQILVTYPNVVAGGFTVTPGDGTAHFGFVTSTTPSACAAGYEKKRRPFEDARNITPNLGVYCAEPKGSPSNVRGAANAPRAEGLKAFPNDATPPQDATAGNSNSNSRASLFAGSTDTQGWTTTYADYDPTSGRAITAQGKRYTLDSMAGATALFGGQSWQWLLMDPLRSS